MRNAAAFFPWGIFGLLVSGLMLAGFLLALATCFSIAGYRDWTIRIVVFIALFFAFWKAPIIRTTPPGRILRFAFGEAGAMQRVNDDADALLRFGRAHELERLCDAITVRYLPAIGSLPRPKFGCGHEIPKETIPNRFRALGGLWGEPVVLLCGSEDPNGVSLVLLWGNGRHRVIVYSEPPTKAPSGYGMRKVSERIYVLSRYS